MGLDLFSSCEGLGLTWVIRRVGINSHPTWRVAVELQKLVHWLCGRAPITEGCGRGHRGWQAHQRAPCGHDLHLGSHPCSNDCHACHDSTPPPKGIICLFSFFANMNDAVGAAVSNCGPEEGLEHNTAATPENYCPSPTQRTELHSGKNLPNWV